MTATSNLKISHEDAEKLLSMLKDAFLKSHSNTALYGAHIYEAKKDPKYPEKYTEAKDRVIVRAVKNGDAPEIKLLMIVMGIIEPEEKTDETA